MTEEIPLSISRYCTYAGCWLLLIPTGVLWYWGNLSVYTDSYFRATLGPNSGFGTPWTASLNLIGTEGGIILSDVSRKYLGYNWACASAILLFATALFSSYFAVHTSGAALMITIGMVSGLSGGLMIGQSLRIVSEWTNPRRVGFFTALVMTGISSGPIFINQLITFYINPGNLHSDVTMGLNTYFTQESVLDRVPSIFLVLGGVTVAVQVMGFLLLVGAAKLSKVHSLNGQMLLREDNRAKIAEDKGLNQTSADQLNDHNFLQPVISCNAFVKNCTARIAGDTETAVHSLARSMAANQAHNKDNKHAQCLESDPGMTAVNQGGSQTGTDETMENNPTCLQMLKSQNLYVLWVCMLCSHYTLLLQTNYYKSYGQLHIKDDHFLANVATAVVIGELVTRPLWGIILDARGVKFILAFLITGLNILSTFWYFTPLASKWMYMVWTMLFGCFNVGINTAAPISILKIFGQKNYGRNIGLVTVASTVTSIASPQVMNVLLKSLGWFALFFTGGVLHTVNLIILLIFLPIC